MTEKLISRKGALRLLALGKERGLTEQEIEQFVAYLLARLNGQAARFQKRMRATAETKRNKARLRLH